MKHYELMYIIPVKAGSEDDSSIQDKVRSMLQQEGATITKDEVLGKRKLAYPIKNLRHGNYIVMELDLDTQAVSRVNNWFRMSPDILRSQLVVKLLKTPEQEAKEKAFREKLQKLQLKETADENQSDKPTPAGEDKPATSGPVQLEDLDKKLEKILEQEIVK